MKYFIFSLFIVLLVNDAFSKKVDKNDCSVLLSKKYYQKAVNIKKNLKMYFPSRQKWPNIIEVNSKGHHKLNLAPSHSASFYAVNDYYNYKINLQKESSNIQRELIALELQKEKKKKILELNQLFLGIGDELSPNKKEDRDETDILDYGSNKECQKAFNKAPVDPNLCTDQIYAYFDNYFKSTEEISFLLSLNKESETVLKLSPSKKEMIKRINRKFDFKIKKNDDDKIFGPFTIKRDRRLKIEAIEKLYNSINSKNRPRDDKYDIYNLGKITDCSKYYFDEQKGPCDPSINTENSVNLLAEDVGEIEGKLKEQQDKPSLYSGNLDETADDNTCSIKDMSYKNEKFDLKNANQDHSLIWKREDTDENEEKISSCNGQMSCSIMQSNDSVHLKAYLKSEGELLHVEGIDCIIEESPYKAEDFDLSIQYGQAKKSTTSKKSKKKKRKKRKSKKKSSKVKRKHETCTAMVSYKGEEISFKELKKMVKVKFSWKKLGKKSSKKNVTCSVDKHRCSLEHLKGQGDVKAILSLNGEEITETCRLGVADEELTDLQKLEIYKGQIQKIQAPQIYIPPVDSARILRGQF